MSALATETIPESQSDSHGLALLRLSGVELRKMLGTRAGFWLMASIVISALLATVAVILIAPNEDIAYVSFATARGFPMTVILPLIAVLSVTSEWSQRTGLSTEQPWIDSSLTQTQLFEGTLSGQQWANLGAAGSLWLVAPRLAGLRLVLRSEVK